MNQLPNLSRRGLMSGAAMLATLAGLDPVRVALAARSLDPLPATGMDETHFMALSVVLTGHDKLDGALGGDLFAAIQANGGTGGLRDLYEFLQAAEAVVAVDMQDEHAAMAQAVLRGWYVGLVATPDGDIARIGYEDALMGPVVDDFLELRSYCGGEPHFWAELPDLDEPIVMTEANP